MEQQKKICDTCVWMDSKYNDVVKPCVKLNFHIYSKSVACEEYVGKDEIW